MAQRIKGQEVTLIFVANGQPIATMTDFKSFEVELMFDRLEEGYLGESSDRFDEVLKGFRGTAELHLENQDFVNFLQAVVDRAQRRNINVKINIQATLNFPDGSRPKFYGNDVFFSAAPLSFGGRDAYGTLKLDFAGSTPRFVRS